MSAQDRQSAPECHGTLCVTCSDAASPMRVLRLLPDDMALAGSDGSAEEISVALVQAEVGGTVLVHAGEAIAVVADPTAAAENAAIGGADE